MTGNAFTHTDADMAMDHVVFGVARLIQILLVMLAHGRAMSEAQSKVVWRPKRPLKVSDRDGVAV